MRAALLSVLAITGCAAGTSPTTCGATSDGRVHLSTLARDLGVCTYAQVSGRARVQAEDLQTTITFVLEAPAGPGTFSCATEGQVSLSYTDASGQTYLARSGATSADRLGNCSVSATASDALHWAGQVTANLLRTPDQAPLSLTASLDLQGS